VEDDVALQSMLAVALEDEGFEVVVASDGAEALAVLEQDGPRLKGVVTDIQLGKGPSGWDVGHRAREIVPGIPMIYMSGDSAHQWTANGVPGSLMLQKPFVLAQLITAITNLLNEASSAIALSDAMAADGNAPATDSPLGENL
jgi:DNA-binding response OmpR family regulator